MYFLKIYLAKFRIKRLKKENDSLHADLIRIKKKILRWQDIPKCAALADQMYIKHQHAMTLYLFNKEKIQEMEQYVEDHK